VVFAAGQPIGRAGSTNLMKLHRVGSGQRESSPFRRTPDVSALRAFQVRLLKNQIAWIAGVWISGILRP